MVSQNIQRSDRSRLWLLENRAGPATVPSYEGLWKAGPVSWPQGDVTNIYVPSDQRYGQFGVAGKIIGERGNPTIPVTARFVADQASTLLRLARLGCDHDVQVHMGNCQDPQDFNFGWEKVLVLEAARPTDYGTTDLGAMEPGERSPTDEEVPLTGEDYYEILRIVFGPEAATEIVQQVIDVAICDEVTCGECGIPSNGCDTVFGLTATAVGSPGLPAEIIFTEDGGLTWSDTNIDTLAANEEPNAFACVGANLVVISEDSESIHYAPIADILAGTEVWIEVTTGFVATNGPLAIFSLTPRHTWIVGENGYAYFTTDPTTSVVVQDAGVVTTEDLQAIHGLNTLELVAVGNNNAVILTRDGGTVWSAIVGPAVGVALNTVWMRAKDEWFIGDAGGNLWYTRDAGVNWTQKAFPGDGTGQVREVAFATPTVGYMAHDIAAGPAGRILRTIDGGNSWYVAPEGNQDIPANDEISAIAVCPDDVNVVYGGGLGANGIDGIMVKGSAA